MARAEYIVVVAKGRGSVCALPADHRKAFPEIIAGTGRRK